MTQPRWILPRLTCKRLKRSKQKQGDLRQGTTGTTGDRGHGSQTSYIPAGSPVPSLGPISARTPFFLNFF